MAVDWNQFKPVAEAAPARAGGATDWSQFKPAAKPQASQASAAPLVAAKPQPVGFGEAVVRGFKRSLPETKSLLYGAGAAVAGAVGADGLRDKALDSYQRIQREEVAPLANESGFQSSLRGETSGREWAGDVIGNFGGQAAQSVAAGVVGAAVGSAVPGAGNVAGAIGGVVARGAAKKLVAGQVQRLVAEQTAKGATREVAEAAGKQLLAKRLQQTGGAAAATFGVNAGQEVGISYTGRAEDAAAAGEQLSAGDAVRALGAGTVAGAVDTAAEGIGVGRLLRGSSTSPRFARRVVAGGTAGAVTEGGTEAAQGVIERFGAQRELGSPEAIDEYIENAAAGTLGGSVMGSASGVKRRPQPMVEPAGEITRAADPSVQEVAVPPPLFADARPGSLSDVANAVSAARPRPNDAGWREQLAATSAAPIIEEPVAPLAAQEAAPVPQAPPNVPWINSETGEIRAPTDFEIKSAVHDFMNRVAGSGTGGGMNRGHLTRSLGLDLEGASGGGAKRLNPLLNEVRDERRLGLTRSPPPAAEAAQPEANDLLEQDRAALDAAMGTPTPSKAPAEGVPFMVTRKMKADLGGLGWQGEQIAKLTPQQAWDILQSKTAPEPAAAAAPDAVRETPAAPAEVAAPLADMTYDESPDLLDDDITPPSGGPFSDRGAAETAARREDGGRVFEVDGGFAVRMPRATQPGPDTAPQALPESATPLAPTPGQSPQRGQSAPLPAPENNRAPASQQPALPAAAEPLSEQAPLLPPAVPSAADRPSAQATPASSAVQAAAAEAATSPDNDLPTPTEAQRAAGNFRVGRMKVAGLDVSIEHPAGVARKEGHVPLTRPYGYIRQTEAKDGDHVDVFLGERAADPSLPVFVIDQVDANGKYDEAKVVMGEANEADARAAYASNYPKGWTGLGAITQMTQNEFKAWVKDPVQTKKPAARVDQSEVKIAEVVQAAPKAKPSNASAVAESGLVPADSSKPVASTGKVIMRNGRPQYAAGARETLEAYFQPGRIVKGYAGADRVLGFDWNDGAWSVRVQRVDKDGNPVANEDERNHRTQPETRELVAVLGKPVGKATRAKAATAASAAVAAPPAPKAEAPAEASEKKRTGAGTRTGTASNDGTDDTARRSAGPDSKTTTAPGRERDDSGQQFSMGSAGNGTLTLARAQELKAELTAKWGDNAPNVVLIQDAEGFPAGAKVDPSYRRGEGFYNGSPTVWINLGQITTEKHFAEVLAHEALGHYGVERVVGKEQWAGIVDAIEKLDRDKTGSDRIRQILAEVHEKQPGLSRDNFAREAIAFMAEKGIRNTFTGRVIAAVRRYLRQIMPTIQWSENDVRGLLSAADGFLHRGRPASARARMVQSYAFSTAQDDGAANEIAADDAFVAEQVKSTSNRGTFDRSENRMLFSKAAADPMSVVEDIEAVMAEGEHTAGADPSRPFAPTIDLDNLQFDKRPLSYAIKGGLDWLKKNAWLPMMPANYLVDYARPGQKMPAVFMSIKNMIDSLRGELHNESNEHAQSWLKYASHNRKEAQLVADVLHEGSLAGVDPSKDYSKLKFRYGGKDWDATVENGANAVKAIKQQARGRAGDKKGAFYETKDMIEAMVNAEKTRPAKHKALQAKFNQLSDAGKAQVTSTYAAYAKRDELLTTTLLEGIEKEMDHALTRADRTHERLLKSFEDQGLTGDELATAKKRAETKHLKDRSTSRQNKAARLKKLREDMEGHRLQGPYVPIARYGEYFVTVRDAAGKVLSFSKFESSGDQQWYADQVAKHLPALRVERGLMGNKDQVRGAVDPGFVADVEEMLDNKGASSEMLDAVWQRYLETLPDFSIRKQFIHRKGTAGYQQDALRAFGKTMFHSAHQIAKLKHGSDLTATVDLMREEAKTMDDQTQAEMLANEFEERLKWIMNPTGSSNAQKITSFAFIWNLAISPASALVNGTQTPVMGIPILGARLGGMTKAAGAIAKASADLLRSKDWQVENSLKGEEKAAMEAFFTAGLLDRTHSHAVMGIGDSGVEYSAVREKVMQKMSFLFHHMERINRETTSLAAYRMARVAGRSHEAAIDVAMELTWKVHFDMSNSSRARALKSDSAKIIMVHRAHSLNMSIRMLRDAHQMFKGETPEARLEARRQFIGIMGMHALVAGVMGVPFYGIAMVVAGFAKDAFGDDDDDRTPEDLLKRWFYDAMPKEVADIVLYGAPSKATGLSLYNRIGFPDLFFRDAGREMEGRSEAEYWINQTLGPAVGLAVQTWDGMNLIRKGELWRGTEKVIPKGLRDAMKTARFAREGVLTLNGDPVVDELNAWELIGQAAGFAPFKVSEAYEQRTAKKSLQTAIQQRKAQVMNRYALGFRLRDQSMIREALQNLQEFNRAYPEKAISAMDLRSSIRQRAARAARNQTGGLVIEKALEGRIERELGY